MLREPKVTGVLIHDSLRRGKEDAQACMTRCFTMKFAGTLHTYSHQHVLSVHMLPTYWIFNSKTLRQFRHRYFGHDVLKINDFFLDLESFSFVGCIVHNLYAFFIRHFILLNHVSVLRKTCASLYVISGHVIAHLCHKFWSQRNSENLYLNYSKEILRMKNVNVSSSVQ